MTKHGEVSLTTDIVHVGTRLAVSLHRRNTTECVTGMTKTCATSSAAKMHITRSKTCVRSASDLNWSDVKGGTMTTVIPIMTNLIDSVRPREGTMQESRPFPTT
jgi:hypothetical protein